MASGSDPMILLVMAILAMSLFFLGEKTSVGVYFIAACIPIVYIMLQVGAFMMYAFGGLLVSFAIFRSLHPSK